MTTDEKLKIIYNWSFSYHRGDTYVGIIYNILAEAGFEGFAEYFQGEMKDSMDEANVELAYTVTEKVVWDMVCKL